MNRFKGGDDVQSKYTAMMGEELGVLFYAISKELTRMHVHWAQFRILFGEKRSRIAVVNKAAPVFFAVLQDTLFHDTVLAIARITDPLTSLKRKENLTIQRFPMLINDPTFRNELRNLIKQANKAAEFAKDRRNRRIAHLDLGLSLNGTAQPLVPTNRKSIEDSLSAIAVVLDTIEVKYCEATTAYALCSPSPGDALSLLGVLRDGLLFREDRNARRARGEWDWDSEIERKRREPI